MNLCMRTCQLTLPCPGSAALVQLQLLQATFWEHAQVRNQK
jgi:hypothetical protein